MKKFKKIFAVLLTLAMVLGMSMTSFAAQVTDKYTNNIKVSNLTAGVDTEVKAYNIIYLDRDSSGNENWVVVDWADAYIDLNQETGEYTINDKEGLKKAVERQTHVDSQTVSGTECTFTGLPIGAYVIWANDSNSTYELMVANTYDENEKYLAAKAADVTAKVSNYTVKKEASDNFVRRGQEVTFTVTTQFPAKTNEAGETLDSFKIKDTPKGLLIAGLPEVTIAGTEVTITRDMVKNTLNDDSTMTTGYEVDLSSFIAASQAGQTVVVKYTATVIDDKTYNNTAGADSNTVTYGTSTTEGFEGDITVTKVDEKGETLKGAEFEIYEGSATGTPLQFVKVSNGNYKLALDDEDGAGATVAVDADGKLVLTGLDEGTYYIKETLAPEGYSLVEDPKEVTITAAEEHVSVAINFENTKLGSLPSTGGIGTTIFTIGGCAIMIIAAALFFASRRKSSK